MKVIWIGDVSKVGEEEIREAMEAGEMVMQVDEQCSQAERLPVRMT